MDLEEDPDTCLCYRAFRNEIALSDSEKLPYSPNEVVCAGMTCFMYTVRKSKYDDYMVKNYLDRDEIDALTFHYRNPCMMNWCALDFAIHYKNYGVAKMILDHPKSKELKYFNEHRIRAHLREVEGLGVRG